METNLDAKALDVMEGGTGGAQGSLVKENVTVPRRLECSSLLWELIVIFHRSLLHPFLSLILPVTISAYLFFMYHFLHLFIYFSIRTTKKAVTWLFVVHYYRFRTGLRFLPIING
jgi:hypothetical protein